MSSDDQEGLKVKILSEKLAKHLKREHSIKRQKPGKAINDAYHNLQYGQYDEFASNIAAGVFRKEISLSSTTTKILDELVNLMKLEREIEEVREYIATHPEPPTDLPSRRFG